MAIVGAFTEYCENFQKISLTALATSHQYLQQYHEM